MNTERVPHHVRRAEKGLGNKGHDEARDREIAEHAERLMRFVHGEAVPEVWKRDLLPILEKLYARYQRVMVQGGESTVWALRAIEDVATVIAGEIQLGQKAMERIAERRLKSLT